jgi:phage shock protein PspC (stress-responsive transcriptional regulator)
MARLGAIGNADVLWWSLSLGACLGGNGTLVGASANLVVAGMAERYGQPISFIEFFKVGFPLMIMSVFIATVYVGSWFVFKKELVLLATLALGVALSLVLGRLNVAVYKAGTE